MTKHFITVFLFVYSMIVSGQTKLPDCSPGFVVESCYGNLDISEGETYNGEIKKQKRHGKGVFSTNGGERFAGSWVDDTRNGYGASMTIDNQKSKTVNSLLGKTTITVAKTNFAGEWKNNRRYGFGIDLTSKKAGWWDGDALTSSAKVFTFPLLIINRDCIKIDFYPRQSIQLGEIGTVELRFLIDEEGRLLDVVFENSSGFRRLDQAAKRIIENCYSIENIKRANISNAIGIQKITFENSYEIRIIVDHSQIEVIEAHSPKAEVQSCKNNVSTVDRAHTINRATSELKTTVIVEVSELGEVRSTKIGRSSGNESFDFYSIATAMSCKYFPGIVKGQKVSGKTFIDVSSRAENGNISITEARPDSRVYGEGLFVSPDGSRYSGEFLDGQRHGIGSLKLIDGNEYVGEFANDKFSGQGTYSFINGNKYIGGFSEGMREGNGKWIQNNGNQYIGDWKNDRPAGRGIFVGANGSRYVGEFLNGMRHGKGAFLYADGGKYEGDFRADKSHGNGTYTSKIGEKYTGEFRDGRYNGRGVFTYNNGNKYVGEFINNEVSGEGILYGPDGSILQSGKFESGKLVSSYTIDKNRFHFSSE